MSARARRRTPDARGRRLPAELLRDPEYLAFKESIGERLAPSERAVLDAHRQVAHYVAYKESLARDRAADRGGCP